MLVREGALVDGPRAIMWMNHEGDGFDCPGRVWPDDTRGLHAEFSAPRCPTSSPPGTLAWAPCAPTTVKGGSHRHLDGFLATR